MGLVCIYILFNCSLAHEYLVLVDDMVESQKFHVIEQIQNKAVVIATNEDISLMHAKNLPCKILDENPRENSYYLVYPVRETRQNIERIAEILADFQGVYLVKVLPMHEQNLSALDVELNYLEFERMVFETCTPMEILKKSIIKNSEIQKIVNSVSTDTLVSFIRYLQSIPSRHVSFSFNAEKAAPWIVKKLEEYGCDSVYLQQVPGYNAPNAIGIKLGTKFPSYTKYFIIGGHPDCMPNQNPNHGADDNATGTAAFLETARVLKNYTFDYTIVFIAFNAEEVGMKGSAYYAQVAKGRGDSILSVLNMERCGHVFQEAKILLTHKQSMPETKALADLFMQAANTYTKLVCAYNPQELTNSDHASFWNKGYCAIMAKEEHQPEVYHTVNDTLGHPNGLNNLNFHTRVVQTGVATIAELANLSSTGIDAHTSGQKSPGAAFTFHKISGRQFILRSSLQPSQINKITLYNIKGQVIQTFGEKRSIRNQNVNVWHEEKWTCNFTTAGVYIIELRSEHGTHFATAIVP